MAFNVPGNSIPLAMLRDQSAGLETRAAATLTAPGRTSAPVIGPVFAMGLLDFMSIPQNTVPNGDAVFPVITSRPTVSTEATNSSSAVSETDAQISGDVLSPQRFQAGFSFRRTDQARMGDLDDGLSGALREGLSEALDAALVTEIVAETTRAAASAVDTFATIRSRVVFNALDGRHANDIREVRAVIGVATVKFLATLYRGNNADVSSYEFMRDQAGGLRVSPHVAGVSGNKQDILLRVGSRPDATAALWDGVTLLVDPYSREAEGEIRLTGILLGKVEVLRASGFARIQSQHA